MYKEIIIKDVYKNLWEEFKFKRGDTYVDINRPHLGTIRDDMNEFEKKYLEELKEYNEYIKTFKAGYGEKPMTTRPKPRVRP